MSELDARYARGQDTRRMFGGGTIPSAGSAPGAWDVAPDLERMLGEALFGYPLKAGHCMTSRAWRSMVFSPPRLRQGIDVG